MPSPQEQGLQPRGVLQELQVLQEECRKIVSPLIAAMQAFSVVALLLGLTLSGKAAKDKKATRRATISRGSRKSKVRQCLGLVQLIHTPRRTENQLYKNTNIA